jgi:hypothetical protein
LNPPPVEWKCGSAKGEGVLSLAPFHEVLCVRAQHSAKRSRVYSFDYRHSKGSVSIRTLFGFGSLWQRAFKAESHWLAIRREAPLWFPSMRPILRKSNLTRILLGISVVAACVFAGTQGNVSTLPVGRLEAELLEAVRLGDRAEVDALLQKGAAPSAKLPDGTSALMEATVADDAGMLRALLDRGADVNTKNQAGATALMWAAGDLDKTRYLHTAPTSYLPYLSMTPSKLSIPAF